MEEHTMGIAWGPDEQLMREMEKRFLLLGKKAISMNHYDLAIACEKMQPFIPANVWKTFLMDGRVSAYVSDEFDAIKNAELRKIVVDINSSRSVGQAQIINSLNKMLEGEDKQHTGPAFIYSYIPLTEDQAQAPNVRVLQNDPFIIPE